MGGIASASANSTAPVRGRSPAIRLDIPEPAPEIGNDQLMTSAQAKFLGAESATYPNVDAVIDRLKRLQAQMVAKGDVRAAWVTTYLVQTEATKKALQTPGMFEDPRFIDRLCLRFYQYFEDAYTAYEKGDLAHVSEPWKRVFDMAKSQNAFTIEDVTTAIDVHINYDLPRALAAVGAKPGANYRDYMTYNQLFSQDLQQAKQRIINLSKPVPGLDQRLLGVGDKALLGLDDKVTLDLINQWRQRSWRESQRLEQGDRRTLRQLRVNTLPMIHAVEDASNNPLHRFLARLGLL
jgi:hypothetical protein